MEYQPKHLFVPDMVSSPAIGGIKILDRSKKRKKKSNRVYSPTAYKAHFFLFFSFFFHVSTGRKWGAKEAFEYPRVQYVVYCKVLTQAMEFLYFQMKIAIN